MTDIRKCAQAVIDVWEANGVLLDWVDEDVAIIEALRQALAEPVEPVGKKLTREELSHTDGRIEFVWWKDIPHGAFIYTTPPSLDALIGEIESIVTCAETAVDGDTGDTYYIGEAYPKEDVLAILDKYRGVK